MTKTKWLVGGVVTSLMTGTLFGCTQDLPPKPNDNSCSDWDWDDELGVWQCDDSSSGYRGHYFYGGRYYQNKSTFKIHRRLNRINRLRNLKVELEAVQRRIWGLTYVAIYKGSKRVLFEISGFLVGFI